MSIRLGSVALVAIAAVLSGCGKPILDADTAATGGASVAAAGVEVSAAAEAVRQRFEGDAENDARRKVADTIAFFGITRGQNVFEMEAGGGYWTELLAMTVAPGGQVVMQNPPGFIPFVKDELDRRFANGRLAEVRQTLSAFDKLDAADASMDIVTWMQGPHELYYVPDAGEGLGDPAASYAEIFRILKPGGVFAVIDHAAAAGAPTQVGHDLHRVDPAVVQQMAAAAGFIFEAEAQFLRNPADDLNTNVFDPAVRGQTDQFVLRFRKPA